MQITVFPENLMVTQLRKEITAFPGNQMFIYSRFLCTHILKHGNRLKHVGLTSQAGQRVIHYLRTIKASKMQLTTITG